jgi:hypothetical protein
MKLRQAGFWPLKPIHPLQLIPGIILLSLCGWLIAEHLFDDGSLNLTVAALGGMGFVVGLIAVAEAIWRR